MRKQLRKIIIFILKIIEKQTYTPSFLGILINPLFIIRRSLFVSLKTQFFNLKGKVLDFGCGASPYKDYIKYDSFTGLDYENTGHPIGNSKIDVFYNGKTIPFDDKTFDSVLCTEVLEHTPMPNETLIEIYRVLKPSGYILITVPFVWNEHEIPYDFYRFSYIGISRLIEKAGFKIQYLKKTTNFFHTSTQLFTNYLHTFMFTKYFLLNILINFLFIFPFNLLGWLIGWLIPDKNKNLSMNIVILAQK